MTRETLLTTELLASSFSKNNNLPVMHEVGSQIIALKDQEDVDLRELVELIESDPAISAKIISYASSPFFSYQGKLDSVQEAIHHVLGMDMSMNVAFSMALGNQFNGPIKGPVGAMSIWSHSVYCAVLSQTIASKIKNKSDINPKTAYLYGLLHNIGFLALGHMFSEEFNQFNKIAHKHKEIPINKLERKILGVTHTKAGSLLMDSWALPEEYGIVVEHHHDSEYTGPHQVYSHISFIANALLKKVNVGDAVDVTLPAHLLEEYNLSETQLDQMLKTITQWQENINHLARQLAA